jgi:hypothetical protein
VNQTNPDLASVGQPHLFILAGNCSGPLAYQLAEVFGVQQIHLHSVQVH